MKFFFGLAFGAFGMWAYQNGKLESLMGGAREPMRQAWKPAAERLSQLPNNEHVRQVASTVQEKMHQAQGTEIVTPSATEISGRPSEPLPTQGA